MDFTQDYFVYSPKKQGIYPIPESEWSRLKGLITKIIPEKKIYNILASICFGILISSIFSLITFYTIKLLPTWILPTNWAILVSSLILGIVLLIIDSQQKDIIKFSSTFITSEMTDIEKRFEKQEESTM